MATKKYEGMRIMSLEGSVLYKNEGFTATKDGKPDPGAFRGVLDESLDTLKLAEVYGQHEDEMGYPYLDGKKRFCRAVVNLSFNRAVKVFESYGNRYVLNGYRVTDEDMQDHVCVRIVNGIPTLIAIDVSFRENSGYAPVEEPISDAVLGKYFKYDSDTRTYKRSDKTIPTDITCLEIREHLYTHGFDIDGVHYVRYKRSAGASRDGRCLFIAEPLYADMLDRSPVLRYQINMTTDHATIAEQELPDLAKYRRDTVLDMTCRTPLFEQTEFYKSFRSDTVKHFKSRLKDGRIAVCGNYQVLFGNAYEFLVALTDESYEPTFSYSLEDGQVCTTGFAHGEMVLCARSPHITMGNLYLAKNTNQGDILTYFNLTPNIICVNAIESNIQQRLGGCDYDSDSMLVTNDPWIIAGVTGCYNILKVPVCKAEPVGKTDYVNTPRSLAKLDQTIAKNKIGEIVNLSQFLNCLLWDGLFTEQGDHHPMDIYHDICILAVLSGMEIDKAKRLYSADSTKVLSRLRHYRQNYKRDHGGNLPAFYKYIVGDETPDVGENNAHLEAPMAFVHDAVDAFPGRAAYTSMVSLSDLFELDASDAGANDTHKKQNIIKAVKEAHTKITAMQTAMKDADDDEKLILCDEANEVYKACLKIVSKNVANDHILCMLLSEIDHPEKSKYGIKSCRHLLLACLLYEENRRLLSKIKTVEGFEPYDLVRVDPESVPEGYRTEDIYGFPHGHLLIK